MSFPVVLDPEARAEFDEGYDFYESRRAGLGERFADAVQVVRAGREPPAARHRSGVSGNSTPR